jgi:Na+/melibiose symporter-like transporter
MKLNYKRTFLVGLGFFSICAFWQLYDHVVPLILTGTFGVGEFVTGFIMSVDNILALFLLPLFGAISDRTRTKMGRRKPYLIAGTAGACLSMLLIPIAHARVVLWLFIAGLGLVLLFMASYRSPTVALMPDVTPKPLRSPANAVINLMGAVGGIIILLLIGIMLPSQVEQGVSVNYFPIFISCIAIMLVAVLVLVFKVKEPQLVREMEQESEKYGVEDEPELSEGKQRLEGVKLRSMLLLLASVVLWFTGYNAVTTWYSTYCREVFGLEAGGSALVMMVAQGAAIVAYVPVGFIAARVGRRKCIMAGIIMLAAAFGLGALFTSENWMMYGVFMLAGVAWATINVNSYPMVVEMARGATVGQFTGYYYTASMAAQVLTPTLSGALIENISYRLLFPYGAVFVALALVTMLFVRHGDSKPVPAASRLEAFDGMDN